MVELRLAEMHVIEARVEIAGGLAQVAAEDFGVEQRCEPAQPNEPVHRRRFVEPREGRRRREIDTLVAYRLDALPHRAGPDRAIEALVEGDDHFGVPGEDLLGRGGGEVVAGRPSGGGLRARLNEGLRGGRAPLRRLPAPPPPPRASTRGALAPPAAPA